MVDSPRYHQSFPHPPRSHSLPPAHPQSRRPAAMRLTGSHQVLSILYIYYNICTHIKYTVVCMYIYIIYLFTHIMYNGRTKQCSYIYILILYVCHFQCGTCMIYHGIFLGLPHVQTNWFITTQVVFGDFSAAEPGEFWTSFCRRSNTWMLDGGHSENGEMFPGKKTDDEAMDLE